MSISAYELTVDGRTYKVRVVFPTMDNEFEIVEGNNAGRAQNGREIRDIIGTAYSYTMEVEPNPLFPEDYDALFDVLSAPVESHRVSLPYGQGELEFDAAISGGKRTWHGCTAGFQRWKGMEVAFRPISPQRTE